MSMSHDITADKSLCVSLIGDADEAKAFRSGSSSRDNSGVCVCVCVCVYLPCFTLQMRRVVIQTTREKEEEKTKKAPNPLYVL